MGSREFISCAIQELTSDAGTSAAFLLSCDDIADIDSFEVVAHQQLTVTIQQFCRAASTLRGVLILENVHPDLCVGRGLERARRARRDARRAPPGRRAAAVPHAPRDRRAGGHAVGEAAPAIEGARRAGERRPHPRADVHGRLARR